VKPSISQQRLIEGFFCGNTEKWSARLFVSANTARSHSDCSSQFAGGLLQEFIGAL
jgi:hypothetical protein